jgi:predicted kinase
MPGKQPVNVIVFGLPGSGKTYFAEKLAGKINGLHISSDSVRQHLQLSDKYQEHAKMKVYLELLRLMEKAICQQHDIVMDATFYKADIRNLFKKRAELLKSKIYFIEVRADESTIKDRVKKKRKESEADFKVYLKIKNVFEPLEEDHLILHSGQGNLDHMLTKALAYIHYSDGAA